MKLPARADMQDGSVSGSRENDGECERDEVKKGMGCRVGSTNSSYLWYKGETQRAHRGWDEWDGWWNEDDRHFSYVSFFRGIHYDDGTGDMVDGGQMHSHMPS